MVCSTFQGEAFKHFLFILINSQITLPYTVFWPEEVCSLAFWNFYTQRPSPGLFSQRDLSASAKADGSLASGPGCDTHVDDLPESTSVRMVHTVLCF